MAVRRQGRVRSCPRHAQLTDTEIAHVLRCRWRRHVSPAMVRLARQTAEEKLVAGLIDVARSMGWVS